MNARVNIATAATVLPAVGVAPDFAATVAATAASTCGCTAARLLRQARTFKVLAVYKRSAYLSASLAGLVHSADGDGYSVASASVYNRILCVNASALGSGPLQLTTGQFEGIRHQLKPGIRILNNIESGSLQFSDSGFLEYHRALARQYQQSGLQAAQCLKKLVRSRAVPGYVLECRSQAAVVPLSINFISNWATLSRTDKHPLAAVAGDGLFKASMDNLANTNFDPIERARPGGRTVTENHSSVSLQSQWHAKLEASCVDIARLNAVKLVSECTAASDSVEQANPIKSLDHRFDGLLSMLGRGTGLTPAGDDFICGAFIALRLLGKADQIQILWQVLEPQLLLKTHEISAAHLSEACRGQVTDRSLAVVQAMIYLFEVQQKTVGIEANTENALRHAITRLSAACNTIGASSGWDFLAGLLTTIHVHASQ